MTKIYGVCCSTFTKFKLGRSIRQRTCTWGLVNRGELHLPQRSLPVNTVSTDSFPCEKIRNFGIVAHVDHGKSTLADRLLETTGVIDRSAANRQVLDSLPVERERGITVKAQTATMFYHDAVERFMINLIDTPVSHSSLYKLGFVLQFLLNALFPMIQALAQGHVDFSYEVSRSLAACQGVLLVVDAQQGVQAQTVANFLLAFEAGLTVIPVINKIDLSVANIPTVVEQLYNAFGFEDKEILQVSAKLGTGVSDLLPAVVDRVPCPAGIPEAPLRMLLFDSWYDHYRGVICLVAVVDGAVSKGDKVQSSHTGLVYEVTDLGILQTKEVPSPSLFTGQVGFLVLGMRKVKEAFIGDTFHHVNYQITPLPGFIPAKPMVFAGVYPIDSSDYVPLRAAVEKLVLNDSSVSVYPDSSVALGQGWRLGFLGLLHMDVFRQRLEEEYDAAVIVTSPSVSYKAILQNNEEVIILNPAKFPQKNTVKEYLEPVVVGTLVFPSEYLGQMLTLCQERRGIQQEMMYLDQTRVLLKYILPLSEIVLDFYNVLKSESSGYASFDYEDHGYKPAPLVKIDILLNQNPVDALAVITHKSNAYHVGKALCEKIKDVTDRQLYEIAIQASISNKVIARETVKPLRKNVTAKCYGGDITRKMKLLRKQREGKHKLKLASSVELSKEAFLSIIRK